MKTENAIGQTVGATKNSAVPSAVNPVRQPFAARPPMHGRVGERSHHSSRQGARRPFPQKKEDDVVPPFENDTIRILTLGGVEEVGKNMTAIEFRNDIVIVDMGFQFKEESAPGIDYILPNTKYLEERKGKIRAVVITHGHLDHIGGIPYIMDRIGNPPIYTRNLSALMIKKRQTEFPHLPNLDIRVVEKNETIKAGDLKIRFFPYLIQSPMRWV